MTRFGGLQQDGMAHGMEPVQAIKVFLDKHMPTLCAA